MLGSISARGIDLSDLKPTSPSVPIDAKDPLTRAKGPPAPTIDHLPHDETAAVTVREVFR